MTECWEEQPRKRQTFQWLCNAVRRLVDDTKSTCILNNAYDDFYFSSIDSLIDRSQSREELCLSKNGFLSFYVMFKPIEHHNGKLFKANVKKMQGNVFNRNEGHMQKFT